MKAFLGLGKLVTLVFWGAVLVNLLHPFAYPLNWLLSIAGGLILLIHLIEILVLGGRLKARAHFLRQITAAIHDQLNAHCRSSKPALRRK